MKSYKSNLHSGIGSLLLVAGILITDTNVMAQQQDVDAITSQMKNASPSVRAKLVEILSEMGGPSVVAALVEALGDEASQVRREAADALGEIGDPLAVPALMAAFQDNARDVRREVVESLGELHDIRAVSVLIEALDDESSDVRREAVDALGHMEDPDDKTAINAAFALTKPLLSLVRCYSLTNRLPGNCRISPFNSRPNNTASA